MIRRILWLLPLGGAALWLWAQAVSAPPASPLAYFPPGAMLALEAKDAGQLLREWNASQVKRDWLASDAYRQFAVSSLALRLQEAQQDFGDASKTPIDMTLVGQIAGDRTAFALYNPGDLEFLLVTRMPEARFATTLLGRRRAALSPRNAAGTPYFVATTAGSRRVVAFAIRGEWLVVGTTEALVAESLQRMAANSPGGLVAEEWYNRAAQAAGTPGELRLASNVDLLLASPHFRSYWIQRNRAELAPFLSAISDLDRQPTVWTERRVLVRKQSTAMPTLDAALWPSLLRAVPANAGVYRAWLQPEPVFAAQLVTEKFFDPTPGGGRMVQSAPDIALPGEAGGESDWENGIDEAPFVPGDTRPDATRFAQWLGRSQVTGLLHVQGTKDSADTVWLQQETGIVLTRSGNWNTSEVQAELGRLGPATVQTFVDGNRLLLATSPSLLAAMRAGATANAPGANIRFVGGFRHTSERARFPRYMAHIGRPTYVPPPQGEQREPQFLSDVVGSLSNTLRGVAEQTITTADAADRQTQTIQYRMP